MSDLIPGITDVESETTPTPNSSGDMTPNSESGDTTSTSSETTTPASGDCLNPQPNGRCQACSNCILAALMGKIDDIENFKTNLKIMVYSDPGGRKTSFCGTAPNNLIMDVEKGILSLKSRMDQVAPGVKILPYRSFFTVQATIDQMAMGNLSEFEVFSIDSLSELHKRGLEEVTTREFAAGRNIGERISEYNAITDDHAENNEHIRRMTSSLRDLDRNIIITAHARRVQQRDKSFKIYPDFSEKLANTICGMMDVVAYVEKIEKSDGTMDMLWHFESDYAMVKQRIGIPTPTLLNPTYNDIYQYWAKLTA